MNDKPWWYADRILMFAGHTDRLPFDQHFLKALVAPRALLCTESVDDDYANPVGTQMTSLAANPAFKIYGKENRRKLWQGRNVLVYRQGAHASNDDDWTALLEFAEWHFFDHNLPTQSSSPRNLMTRQRLGFRHPVE